jgi:plasmid rolling circle replication initiator protein Rep
MALLFKIAQYNKRSAQIGFCAPKLEFARLSTGELKLRHAHFCRARLCPMCSFRKSRIWYARMLKAEDQLVSPGIRALFLTLAARNCPVSELRREIKRLSVGWNRMSVLPKYRDTFIGGIRNLEVTRGRDNSCHPHIHAMMFVWEDYFTSSQYISQQQLVQDWGHAMRLDYDPTAHIQAVSDYAHSVREVGKYMVKFDNLLPDNVTTRMFFNAKPDQPIELLGSKHLRPDADWLRELDEQLNGVRAINLSGICAKAISQLEPEDLINPEDGETTGTDDCPRVQFQYFPGYLNYVEVQ